jgi:Xaa-Pro aminopeptidase
MRAPLELIFVAALACASAAPAQVQFQGREHEARNPATPRILPLRERARLQDQWLKKRLDTLAPALMREHGFDMWVLIAREYLEDPALATMLNAENMHARRRTILIFFDPGGGKPVERLTVSRYGLGGLFAPAWEPEKQPDQWKRLGELIAERNPKKIAVNSSAATAFADGLTHSQYQGLLAALPEPLRARVTPTDDLAVEWLATRTADEMAVYPDIVRAAHSVIAEALSDKVITPGKTTSDDVVWWMRERTQALGLTAWFHPSVGILRRGVKGMLEGDTVIQKGDMLWTDYGFTYLRLNTDTQHLGYVLKDGETEAPAGLKRGLAAANAVQDALTSAFRVGRSGNEVLALARKAAIAQGLKPSIYTHPIGHHGHGAGPSIGYWDNQGPSASGERKLRANTAFSIELNATVPVPEWGGQEVEFRSEEDAFFDGEKVRYIDGRQREFHLIGKRRN